MQKPLPSYDLPTKIMHWLLAVLLVAVFALGLWLGALGLFDSRQAAIAMWHKGLGSLTGLLMLLRLLWRWQAGTVLAAVGSRLEHELARQVQLLLYVLVLTAVLSGYLLATGSGRALHWFDLWQIPPMLILDATVLEQVRSLHVVAVWLLVGVTGIHVLAVLKHQLLGREPLLKRML